MEKDLRILTLLFHEIVNSPEDSGFQRKSAIPYKHGIQEFKDNLEIIVRNSPLVVTIDQLEDIKHPKVTMLAFDDGGKSALQIAAFLDEHQVKGHFFITTGLINDPYFLKSEDIITLHNAGHVIGSHSHSHPNVFKSLSYEAMVAEWSRSKQILEDLLQCEISSCSVPGGDANSNTYKSANACGYRYIFDSEPIVNVRHYKNSLILGRICPKRGTSYSEIEKLSNFKGIRKQQLIRQTKKTAKAILYPLYARIHNSRKHQG